MAYGGHCYRVGAVCDVTQWVGAVCDVTLWRQIPVSDLTFCRSFLTQCVSLYTHSPYSLSYTLIRHCIDFKLSALQLKMQLCRRKIHSSLRPNNPSCKNSRLRFKSKSKSHSALQVTTVQFSAAKSLNECRLNNSSQAQKVCARNSAHVLWDAVSQTKYCCSLKVKRFGLPQNFGLATPLVVQGIVSINFMWRMWLYYRNVVQFSICFYVFAAVEPD